MTDDRSFERAARSWLETGPTEAPDHAVDAALLRIQTTSQERDWLVPRRVRSMTLASRLVAAAITIAVVAVGGTLLFGGGNGPTVGGPNPSAVHGSPSVLPSATARATASAVDYSALPGRILIEHQGNAPDGSEPADGEYHIDRKRFYWMDPASMTGATASEFLKGQPFAGKVLGDVSSDQQRIVFQDGGDSTGEYLWTANLDGTGLTKIVTACNAARAACGDWQPAFDPTGTKVVFVRAQADTTILEIKDLTTGKETRLLSTEGPIGNDSAEEPAWSPDGTKIAFGRVHLVNEQPTKATVSVVDIATDRSTVLPIPLTFPGDPHWSKDGTRILVTDGPVSMASVPLGSAGRTGEVYTVAADGSDVRQLTHSGGNVIAANYTPDGAYVLFFNNYFWLVRSDGTDPRPVNARGDDLSEMNVGFAYTAHWIDTP